MQDRVCVCVTKLDPLIMCRGNWRPQGKVVVVVVFAVIEYHDYLENRLLFMLTNGEHLNDMEPIHCEECVRRLLQN